MPHATKKMHTQTFVKSLQVKAVENVVKNLNKQVKQFARDPSSSTLKPSTSIKKYDTYSKEKSLLADYLEGYDPALWKLLIKDFKIVLKFLIKGLDKFGFSHICLPLLEKNLF